MMHSKFLSRCRFLLAFVLLARSERLPDTDDTPAPQVKAYVDEFTVKDTDHGHSESFAVLHQAFIVKDKKTANKHGVDATKKITKKTAKAQKTLLQRAKFDHLPAQALPQSAPSSFQKADHLKLHVPTATGLAQAGAGTRDIASPRGSETPDDDDDDDISEESAEATADDEIVPPPPPPPPPSTPPPLPRPPPPPPSSSSAAVDSSAAGGDITSPRRMEMPEGNDDDDDDDNGDGGPTGGNSGVASGVDGNPDGGAESSQSVTTDDEIVPAAPDSSVAGAGPGPSGAEPDDTGAEPDDKDDDQAGPPDPASAVAAELPPPTGAMDDLDDPTANATSQQLAMGDPADPADDPADQDGLPDPASAVAAELPPPTEDDPDDLMANATSQQMAMGNPDDQTANTTGQQAEPQEFVSKANASEAVARAVAAALAEEHQTTGVMNFANFLALATKLKWDVLNKGAMERVFNSMAGGSKLCPGDGVVTCPVSQEAFANACVIGPHHEFVSRLFLTFYNDQVRCPGTCPNLDNAGEHIEDVNPNMSSFVAEFRKLDRVGPCWPSCFRVKENYDFSASTQTNYAALPPTDLEYSVFDDGRAGDFSGRVGDFLGKYGFIRSTRDSQYHGHYAYARAFWQDEWVDKVTKRAPAHVKDPWLIYLAGGMASGKGKVLEYLANHGYLGLEHAVYINPDYFKSVMPEYDEYRTRFLKRAEGEEAKDEGMQTHVESGYMEELVLWESLRRGSHIVEDGSLRDAQWFAGDDGQPGLISLIKEKYPMYRVAVLLVDLVFEGENQEDARNAEVLRRLAKRAAEERTTDVDKALASYKQSAVTVKRLVMDSVADFVVHIDNGESQPKVVEVYADGKWSDPSSPEDPNLIISEKLGPAALTKWTAEQIEAKRARYNGLFVGLSQADSDKISHDYQQAVAKAWPKLLDYVSGALPRDETVPVNQFSGVAQHYHSGETLNAVVDSRQM